MTDLTEKTSIKRKADKKINIDDLITNENVVNVQKKMLNELKQMPMDEEKPPMEIEEAKKEPMLATCNPNRYSFYFPQEESKEVKKDSVTHSSEKYSTQLPSGDNDCWKSTPEGKTRHYDPMPICAIDEDVSKNHAIQEWVLNHLPLKEEQKEMLIMAVSQDKKLKNLEEDSSTMMTYPKKSKTAETYKQLKEQKKKSQKEGKRLTVKNREPSFIFSKTEVQCHLPAASGDSSTTIPVHLVTQIKRPLETLSPDAMKLES